MSILTLLAAGAAAVSTPCSTPSCAGFCKADNATHCKQHCKCAGCSFCRPNGCPMLLERLASPDALARSFGAKRRQHVSDKFTGHSYQHMYQQYFRPLAVAACARWEAQQRHTQLRLLEIGLGCGMDLAGGETMAKVGGSLRIWRSLFPSPPFQLELHTVEYNATCARLYLDEHPELAGHLHVGSQNSAADLGAAYAAAGGAPFDVIVDDGSHVGSDQYVTLTHAAREGYVVRDGGIYFVEDIQGSCGGWEVIGDSTRQVDGTAGCMLTTAMQPTFFANITNWGRQLTMGLEPKGLPGVGHIDLHKQAAVFVFQQPPSAGKSKKSKHVGKKEGAESV